MWYARAYILTSQGGPSTKIPSNAQLPQCAFHLYRHLSKTGGTTLRFIFDKQTAMGEWEYPLIYGGVGLVRGGS